MSITLRTSRVKQLCCTVLEKENVTVISFCGNNMIMHVFVLSKEPCDCLNHHNLSILGHSLNKHCNNI